MTKAFLISMVILTFAAFGVAIYVVDQNSITVDEEAQKLSPATLNRSLPDDAGVKNKEATPATNPTTEMPNNKTIVCLGMNYDEAAKIASAGGCGEDVRLKEKLNEANFCNEVTKTFWIDMDIDKPGCSPACVVNIETKTAEINWRCTGYTAPAVTIPTGGEIEPKGVMTN